MEDLTIKKIFLSVVFIFCVSCNRVTLQQTNTRSGNLFVTIDWCGVTTRPPIEVALATKDALADARQWAADQSADRRVAVIEISDMGKIERLLENDPFQILKHSARPDFRVQQYYINVRSKDTPQFFYLGLDAATVSLLREMQAALPSDAAAKLQSIIDNLTQKK